MYDKEYCRKNLGVCVKEGKSKTKLRNAQMKYERLKKCTKENVQKQ